MLLLVVWVYPGIFIGNKGVAEDVMRLSAMGVTHLLNCARGVSGEPLTNQRPVLVSRDLPRPMRGPQSGHVRSHVVHQSEASFQGAEEPLDQRPYL